MNLSNQKVFHITGGYNAKKKGTERIFWKILFLSQKQKVKTSKGLKYKCLNQIYFKSNLDCRVEENGLVGSGVTSNACAERSRGVITKCPRQCVLVWQPGEWEKVHFGSYLTNTSRIIGIWKRRYHMCIIELLVLNWIFRLQFSVHPLALLPLNFPSSKRHALKMIFVSYTQA